MGLCQVPNENCDLLGRSWMYGDAFLCVALASHAWNAGWPRGGSGVSANLAPDLGQFWVRGIGIGEAIGRMSGLNQAFTSHPVRRCPMPRLLTLWYATDMTAPHIDEPSDLQC